MSLLVTGSIAFDTVKTPHGISEDCLGGAAVYFSMAASFFSPVRLVGVVGGDFSFDLAEVFAGRDVDLTGMETRAQSKTFRWAGRYHDNMDDRTTELTELNVLAEAPPKVPDVFKDSQYVFLANTVPAIQLGLLEQVEKPTFVAADTMNLWIQEYLTDLKILLKKIDCLFINEDEARMLADEHNLIVAARKILDMGMNTIIIKKGESGSILCNADSDIFILPAYPADEVIDPTGAGDSFAGGFMGYIAKTGKTDFETLKTAIAYGTVTASFTIADFSLNSLTKITQREMDDRLSELRNLVTFS